MHDLNAYMYMYSEYQFIGNKFFIFFNNIEGSLKEQGGSLFG